MAATLQHSKVGPVQRRRQAATTLCSGFAIIAAMLALLWLFVDVARAARRSGALRAAAMATLGTACTATTLMPRLGKEHSHFARTSLLLRVLCASA